MPDSYRARIQRLLARGLTRTQARGHGAPVPKYDPELEETVREKRDHPKRSLDRIAHAHRLAPERVRRYWVQTGVAQKDGRRWVLIEDRRPRRILMYSDGRAVIVVVPGHQESRLIGQHRAAVGLFLDTRKREYLVPFVGEGIRDVRGRFHPFETRPNELYRLTAPGPEPFEQIYKIVV